MSPDVLLRSSPWGCSAPSPSSIWGASTASCAAAWFRGSSRRRRTRGNSGRLAATSALSLPNLYKCTTVVRGWGGVQEGLRMHFRCQLLLWQMFTLCYSSDVTPPWTSQICFHYFLSEPFHWFFFPPSQFDVLTCFSLREQPYSEQMRAD